MCIKEQCKEVKSNIYLNVRKEDPDRRANPPPNGNTNNIEKAQTHGASTRKQEHEKSKEITFHS